MKKDKPAIGGVRVHVTLDMIRDYRKMPPEMRLAWLEEAAKLSFEALTPKRRKIWEKFRKGEI